MVYLCVFSAGTFPTQRWVVESSGEDRSQLHPSAVPRRRPLLKRRAEQPTPAPHTPSLPPKLPEIRPLPQHRGGRGGRRRGRVISSTVSALSLQRCPVLVSNFISPNSPAIYHKLNFGMVSLFLCFCSDCNRQCFLSVQEDETQLLWFIQFSRKNTVECLKDLINILNQIMCKMGKRCMLISLDVAAPPCVQRWGKTVVYRFSVSVY